MRVVLSFGPHDVFLICWILILCWFGCVDVYYIIHPFLQVALLHDILCAFQSTLVVAAR